MDTLITLIREWHPLAQFVFLLFTSFFLAVVITVICTVVETFINKTLPVIFRGWPPGYKEEEEPTDGEDSNN